ncbi:MAG: PspC domain-containing protein [Candidatus Izimaplasma sp.]|nr:PspC domain-containing protein [Candidatus Izimaplasma bacterium]
MSNQKRLYKNEEKAIIGGVCQGLAEYTQIDVTLMRLLVVFVAIFTTGIPVVLIYLIMWIVLPNKKELDLKQSSERHDAFSKKNNDFDLDDDDFTIDEKEYYD